MPGHFLLKHYSDDGKEILIDCFNRGDILSRQDCQSRLDEIYSGEMKMRPEFLHPISRRQILTRMLNNLKTIYLSTRNFRKALPIADLVLVIHPQSAEDVKQRALLRYSMGMHGLAAEDLDEYLKISPNGLGCRRCPPDGAVDPADASADELRGIDGNDRGVHMPVKADALRWSYCSGFSPPSPASGGQRQVRGAAHDLAFLIVEHAS